MATSGWPDDSMFQHFTIFEETFKVVDSHEIKLAFLIPKGIKPGSHPAIFNIHGGFLVYADSLFAGFFSPWVLKLALENSAVIVSPDYRLLPSAKGVADILEDLEDFWQWTHSALPEVLESRAPGISLDLSHLLLTGNSGGGYAAIQLALSHPDDISAVATPYPYVKPNDDLMVKGVQAGEPEILGLPLEDTPSKNDVLAWIEEAKNTVISKAGIDRTPFAVGATHHGLFYSKIFDSANLNRTEFLPIERIKAGARLPKKIWITHGDKDSVVYIRTAHEFVDVARQKLPETTIRFDIAPGEDHGFDLLKVYWELYAIGALDFVKKAWLED